MTESSGLVFALLSNSIVYDMPEHPPCLTPILRQRSSFRSDLILFKCINALSVKAIAGASPPAADGAGAYKIDNKLTQINLLMFNQANGQQ